MKYEKPEYMKKIESSMRNDRIQNMKRPSIIPNKKKYNRKNKSANDGAFAFCINDTNAGAVESRPTRLPNAS